MTREQTKKKIVIVYASQTGQGKIIAETINDIAIEKNFETSLYCISKCDKEFTLDKLDAPLIFICSTTGDGETPETARKCWAKLKRLDAEENKNYLANLNYALLGMGDTNYTQFCNGPKLFHKRFLELGANCFYGPAWADDGTGLELEVEPFKEKLWDALDKFFASKTNKQLDIIKLEQTIESLIEKRLSLKHTPLVIHDMNAGDIELTLPDLAECHLSVEYETITNESSLELSLIKSIPFIYPQSSQGIFKAKLVKKSTMTTSNAEKDCLNVQFQLIDSFSSEKDFDSTENKPDFDYEPGYSVDIVCSNDENEVHKLLQRLNVAEPTKLIRIKSKNESKKLGSNYVKLTENDNAISVEFFFKYCVDIRVNCLKKSMLRMLASYCEEKADELKLLELCSKEGSDHYMSIVKENSLSLLDILNTFESCHPPLDHLIQMLPALTTRSYTLCSYFNKTIEKIKDHTMEIIFNVIEFQKNDFHTYHRNGIATGFLKDLEKNSSFYFLKRKFQNFTFPHFNDLNKPLLMIGPGTGIAPFISFLRSLKSHESELPHELNIHLYYGCRYPFKDLLFKQQLLKEFPKYLKKLSLSYSRLNMDELTENGRKDECLNENFYLPKSKYVQDSIRHNSKEIVSLLNDQNGAVYLCGDAKNMSKDVLNCFTECFAKELTVTMDDAKKLLTNMINTKRYKQDIWA
jgi:methionine synthase reductase